MKLAAPIPLFRIFDYEMAMHFYCHWLGFNIDWEHRFTPTAPRYLQISRDAAVFHLTEHFGDCTPGAKAISARVANIFMPMGVVRRRNSRLRSSTSLGQS